MDGAIAQLGERFNGIEEVVGSIPSGSTNKINKLDGRRPRAKRLTKAKIATTSPRQPPAIPSPDTATNQRAANSRIVIDDVRSQHAQMFIRTPIFDAVILSVIVAELVAVAVRFAGG